jgi:hypothetical protein
MIADNYKKGVLTIIAVALVWLSVKPVLHPGAAYADSPMDVRLVGSTIPVVVLVAGNSDPNNPLNVRLRQ